MNQKIILFNFWLKWEEENLLLKFTNLYEEKEPSGRGLPLGFTTYPVEGRNSKRAWKYEEVWTYNDDKKVHSVVKQITQYFTELSWATEPRKSKKQRRRSFSKLPCTMKLSKLMVLHLSFYINFHILFSNNVLIAYFYVCILNLWFYEFCSRRFQFRSK